MPLPNLFTSLFRKADSEPASSEPVTLTDPLAALIFGATPTYAGKSVTPQTAMSVPGVASAVELIAEAVGTLPAKLFKRIPNGKAADAEHPAHRLIHDESNDWTSAAELRTQLTRDALLHDKGGFAFANRVNGRVVEFIRIDPAAATIKADEITGEPFYIVQQGRKAVRYEYQDMLHIQAFGGQAPITRARNAIGLAMALEEHAARTIGQGARPSGVLSSEKPMKPEAAAGLLEMWALTHGGSGNSGKPAILTDGVTWTQTALSFVDAQFLEQRRFQTEEIARAFRVPPTMLFDLTRGTWSNTEEMGQQFLTYTLKPWLQAWEWAYARVLLTPEERTGHFVEFVTDDLLTVNFAGRATAYGQYRSMGAMTANEVRAGLNLPPLPGGDELQNPYTTPGAPPAAGNDNTPPDTEKDAA